ncbi:DUF445 domain-containing protein [Shewanella sp. JM162201]|uniref:DUF445 domain-containing protein n=1 Tax=Shewanella jiangmenensis TaxID=2837387 RepID=A0ABS5V7T5_9GAMM|nr:DUF445 domain-containing protein [Shewanella jiangmenensis]MBT1445774.1 DUF445 domain-containing protein [Shewanella jiangmenensis]
MNKGLITNGLAAAVTAAGVASSQPLVTSVGLFALSGAVTNELAIHMLFEKVPGLYGSGVIPAKFEAFKRAIHDLMMEQFFTDENIDRFLSGGAGNRALDLSGVIEKVDLTPAFDALVATVAQSSFGGMLSMFGGVEALAPMKAPFEEKMKASITDIAASDEFHDLLRAELERPEMLNDFKGQIGQIVQARLDELTPELVKQLVQNMIREHLGWLVVWGGVFGGLIGLVAGLVQG